MNVTSLSLLLLLLSTMSCLQVGVCDASPHDYNMALTGGLQQETADWRRILNNRDTGKGTMN